MTYEIRSYREEFLQEQERIGREVTKDWSAFGQTPAEQLKNVYSQPDFDPETRLYCFKDGKMVGFLTSKVEKAEGVLKASLEFPMVLPGHEEAESLLFEKALEVLRKKGVRVVRTRAGEAWGKTMEKVRLYGYTFSEPLTVEYSVDVKKATIEDVPGLQDITDYDHGRDLEQMVAIFIKELSFTPEQARENFETINKSDQVLAHMVIRKKGEITGRALVLRHETHPQWAYTGAFYVTDENQRSLFLTKILKICKEKGIERLSTSIYGNLLSMKDNLQQLYESFGFKKTASISFYEKKI